MHHQAGGSRSSPHSAITRAHPPLPAGNRGTGLARRPCHTLEPAGTSAGRAHGLLSGVPLQGGWRWAVKAGSAQGLREPVNATPQHGWQRGLISASPASHLLPCKILTLLVGRIFCNPDHCPETGPSRGQESRRQMDSEAPTTRPHSSC